MHKKDTFGDVRQLIKNAGGKPVSGKPKESKI